MKIFSADWRLRLLQLTVLLTPFSYLPRIYFGDMVGLTFEVSLVQVAGALFIFSSAPSLVKNFDKLWQILPIKILTAFVFYNWASMIWSADGQRTVFLSAFWVFLLLLVCSIISLFLDRKIRQRDITNPMLLGATVACVFGWLQFVMEAHGVGPEFTQLHKNYMAELFGFARIQALALEPQFFASALLAPITYLSWRILNRPHRIYHLILLVGLFSTFLLTVSRGATLGLVAALVFIIIGYLYKNKKPKSKKLFKLAALYLAGLFIALFGVYFSAEMQPKHSGSASIEIFLDQISHGVINIKLANDGQGVDGLVESSTTGRLFMVERALEITGKSSGNYIFGVGAGSFGPVFQETFGGKISNHVTNNQYIEILVELGLIGLVLFLAFVLTVRNQLWKSQSQYRFMLLGLIAGFLVQYLFFSMQANVVHIWIVFGITMGVTLIKGKKNVRTS